MASPDSSDTVISILSVGTALPGLPVDNAALTRALRMKPSFEQWIDAFVGTKTRHLAINLETAEPEYTLADLGESAGRRALEHAGVTPADVDLVVMGTSMPDALMPTTVNVIADRLGVNAVPTYQLQSGCTGAMQALDVASQMLLTGRHRTALVLGGDVCAKHVDLSVDFAALPPAEIVNVMLFGDGAGAAVLTTLPAPDAPKLRRVLVRFVGLDRAPGQIVEWFGQGDRNDGRSAIFEDFKAIERWVPLMSAEILGELLEGQGWKESDLDYLLPPQLSVRMTQRIVDHLGVSGAREVSCVGEIGNTGNALPFFQLERLLPDLEPGGRAVAIAVESSKWIKGGLALEKS